MGLLSNNAVTTGLLVAFALFVVYIRMKNWMHSNIPIYFYILFLIYMRSIDDGVPFWLICTAFALGLMLRFEFMGSGFMKFVKTLEMCALGGIIYLSVEMILKG